MHRLIRALLLVSLVPQLVGFPTQAASASLPFAQATAPVFDDSPFELVGASGGMLSTIEISGTLGLLGEGDSLRILDLGDPHTPRRGARVQTTGPIAGIALSDHLAFAATDGLSPTLDVVDLSEPRAPQMRSRLALSSGISSLSAQGQIVYLPGPDATLRVVDARDPLSPTLHTVYQPAGGEFRAVQAVAVSGTLALAAVVPQFSGLPVSTPHFFVDLLDISNPLSATLLARYTPVDLPSGFMSSNSVSAIQLVGDRAFLTVQFLGRVSSTSVQIMDLADAQMPRFVANVPVGGAFNPHVRVSVAGTTIFAASNAVSTNDHGLRIFDVSAPLSPTLAGVYDPPESISDVAVEGHLAYAVSPDRYVQIFDISDPAAPLALGRLTTTGPALALALSGTTAYLAAGAGGLQIVDLANPAAHLPLGGFPFTFNYGSSSQYSTYATSIALRGTAAYLPTSTKVIDVGNPRAPVERGGPGFWASLVVEGERGYLDNGSGEIWSLRDPFGPTLLGKLPLDGTGAIVGVVGTKVHVRSYTQLVIYEAANPSSPALLGAVDLPQNASTVIAGTTAYAYDGSLLTIDLRNPAAPVVAGRFPDIPGQLYVAGGRGWVASRGQLSAYDLSDPLRPTLLFAGPVPLCGNSQPQLSGAMLVFADHACGLKVVAVSPPVTATVAEQGGALALGDAAAQVTVPAGAFTTPVSATLLRRYPPSAPGAGSLLIVGPVVTLVARDAVGELVTPTRPLSLALHYELKDIVAVHKETLALHRWDGARWVRETSSQLDAGTQTVRASVSELGLFALLGESERVLLPLIAH
jgi:hypothetical protein